MSDEFAEFVTGEDVDKPTPLESTLYLFWTKGIDYNRFCELPMPYIISILKVQSYVSKLEQKELDKLKSK